MRLLKESVITHIIIRLLLLLSAWQACGQSVAHPDSTDHFSKPNYWNTFRTPLILTGVGLIAITDNEVFDKWEVEELRARVAPNFKTHADDYIVAAPAIALYALDAFGIKAKNNIANRTALLLKSEVMVSVATFSLKKITHEQRPDHTTDDSFPSGHTSHVFMAATLLHHEYGADHPWVSVFGYATATGVGVLRIMNDRHWISDVLVGAGIGVLSANVAYATHRYKWGKQTVRSRASIMPMRSRGATGLYVSIPFR
jgi:membrane-associated phospholipid phosphatase